MSEILAANAEGERQRAAAAEQQAKIIGAPNVEKKRKPQKLVGEGDERVGPDKATPVEVDADVDEDEYLSGNVDEHGEPTTVHHQASKEIWEEQRKDIPDENGQFPDGSHFAGGPDIDGHPARRKVADVTHLDLAAAPTLAPAAPGLAEVQQVDVRQGASAFRRPPLSAGRERSAPEMTWPTGR